MIARTMLAAILAFAPTVAAARCVGSQNTSWYHEPQLLPDGSRYRPDSETCASREFPAGTLLRVIDQDTGLGVDCLVSDFGPNPWTHCRLDLSRKAAERIGMTTRGVIRANITIAP